MSENCGTGCLDPEHMIKCFICKAKYHIGIIHFCPTGFYSYPQTVTPNQELSNYLNSPREGVEVKCPDCGSTNIGRNEDENYLCNDCGRHFDSDKLIEPEDQNWSILGVEEEEDSIRRSKRKSIREKGWKGHQRGKTKKREP